MIDDNWQSLIDKSQESIIINHHQSSSTIILFAHVLQKLLSANAHKITVWKCNVNVKVWYQVRDVEGGWWTVPSYQANYNIFNVTLLNRTNTI